MAIVARVLPRHWDGRRLLRFLAGMALVALAFAVPALSPSPEAPEPTTVVTTVDAPLTPGLSGQIVVPGLTSSATVPSGPDGIASSFTRPSPGGSEQAGGGSADDLAVGDGHAAPDDRGSVSQPDGLTSPTAAEAMMMIGSTPIRTGTFSSGNVHCAVGAGRAPPEI